MWQIVRELVDGVVGLRAGNDDMPPGDAAWWESYRGRVDRAAQEAAGRREPSQSTWFEGRPAHFDAPSLFGTEM